MRKRGMRRIVGQVSSIGFLVLVYLFALGPMAMVIVSSFNSAISFPSPFVSFTLRWFSELLNHPRLLEALGLSSRVAVAAAGLATLLGVPIAFVMIRRSFRGKDTIEALFMAPMMIPQIAVGIASLQMFTLMGIRLGEATLIMSHAVFIMPYTIRAALASLHFVDPALEDAAMSLGANRTRAFLRITLPLIRSGVTGGFVLAFIMSFINVPLSYFLSTPSKTTLPIQVFAIMQDRLTPTIAAIGASTIFLAIGVSLFLEKVLKVKLVL